MFTIEETTVECVKDAEEIKRGTEVIGRKVFAKDVVRGEWSTFITLVSFEEDVVDLLGQCKQGDRIRILEAKLKSRRYKQGKKKYNAFEVMVFGAEALG